MALRINQIGSGKTEFTHTQPRPEVVPVCGPWIDMGQIEVFEKGSHRIRAMAGHGDRDNRAVITQLFHEGIKLGQFNLAGRAPCGPHMQDERRPSPCGQRSRATFRPFKLEFQRRKTCWPRFQDRNNRFWTIFSMCGIAQAGRRS